MELGLDHLNFGHQFHPANYHHPLTNNTIMELYNYSSYTNARSFSLFPSSCTPVSTEEREQLATLFVISSVVIGICGAFVGGAAANSEWSPLDWKWEDPKTKVGIINGAVGGILIPFGLFYSNAILGPETTVVQATGGAYLGAAAANKKWKPFVGKGYGWDWKNPATYQGILQGMQTALWPIHSKYKLHALVEEADLRSVPLKFFLGLTFTTKAVISYEHVSEFHQGNYRILEWDRVYEPGTFFAVLEALEVGTRIPLGLAEIGRDLTSVTTAFSRGEEEFLRDVDPWSVFAAGFMAYLYASVENETFDFRSWDLRAFSTKEAILNGLAYGKDFPEFVEDVQRGFNCRRSSVLSQMKNDVLNAVSAKGALR